MTELLLTPNAIPPESHGKNLRSMLPKEDWDLLRIDCYTKADYLCELCGSKGKKHPVEAHEEWEFNVKKRTQVLIKISALCPDCHLVKHIGRASHVGKFEKAFKHFCKVNKLKKEDGETALRDILNNQLSLMTTTYKIDIEIAKKRLLELFQEKEEVLTAFPIVRKKRR